VVLSSEITFPLNSIKLYRISFPWSVSPCRK
jgi:hypothetical protein